jgi:hypothetical protein
MTLGSCSCAAIVLNSSLTELGKCAIHLTMVTKKRVSETIGEILVADSDCGSGAEAGDVEGERGTSSETSLSRRLTTSCN